MKKISTLLKTKLSKKLRDLKEHGLGHTLKKILRDHIHSRVDVVILGRPLDRAAPSASNINSNYVVRFFEPGQDFPRLQKHFPHKPKDFKKLLKDNTQCIVLVDNNDIAAYFWISPHTFYDRYCYRYRFELEPGQIYQFAGIIAPAYRKRRGIINQTMQKGWQYYARQGFKETICGVETNNPVSMKMHFNLGFEERGKLITVRKLLFFRWSREHTYQGNQYSQNYRISRKFCSADQLTPDVD